MKSAIISLVFYLFSIALFGQNSAVDKIFNKYAGQEGFTSVFISKHMFSLFANIDDENDDFMKLLKGLTGIRVLSADSTVKGLNFHKEVMKSLPTSEYTELMVIKEKDQDIKFLVKETNGRMTELLMVIGGKKNTLISIQGEGLSLKSIANLSKSLQIDGMENLDRIKDK